MYGVFGSFFKNPTTTTRKDTKTNKWRRLCWYPVCEEDICMYVVTVSTP
jgi:hypothetical protein